MDEGTPGCIPPFQQLTESPATVIHALPDVPTPDEQHVHELQGNTGFVVHDSNLSKRGASGNPGAIHYFFFLAVKRPVGAGSVM